MHENSYRLMVYFRDKYLPNPNKAVLDVGSRRCGSQPQTYRDVFSGYDYTGMDIRPGPNVDIVGFESIPRTYDAVISGQVMEHVRKPWQWIKQMASYSTQYICIIAPHTAREHRYPVDCFRFFPEGMRSLFEEASITALEIFKSEDDTIGIGEVG